MLPHLDTAWEGKAPLLPAVSTAASGAERSPEAGATSFCPFLWLYDATGLMHPIPIQSGAFGVSPVPGGTPSMGSHRVRHN